MCVCHVFVCMCPYVVSFWYLCRQWQWKLVKLVYSCCIANREEGFPYHKLNDKTSQNLLTLTEMQESSQYPSSEETATFVSFCTNLKRFRLLQCFIFTLYLNKHLYVFSIIIGRQGGYFCGQKLSFSPSLVAVMRPQSCTLILKADRHAH